MLKIKSYIPRKELSKKDGENYLFSGGEVVDFSIDIDKPSYLYLDLSHRFTTNTKLPIFAAANVAINGKNIINKFPNEDINNILFLGNYKGEKVDVTVSFNKETICSSFGLFSIDVDKLNKFCNEVKGADLNVRGSGLYGKCIADEDSTLFLSLPYNDNFVIKVDGKKVPYKRALSDFIAFDVPKGESEISVTFLPKGFIAGIIISLIGLSLTALCVKFKSKIDDYTNINEICRVAVLSVCIFVVTCVYVVSVIAKVLMFVGMV